MAENPAGKIPTYLHGADDQILAFAALFENWPDPALPEDHPTKWLRTATIITTKASDTLGHIHDRTPLLVPTDMLTDWLDPGTTSEADVRALLDSCPNHTSSPASSATASTPYATTAPNSPNPPPPHTKPAPNERRCHSRRLSLFWAARVRLLPELPTPTWTREMPQERGRRRTTPGPPPDLKTRTSHTTWLRPELPSAPAAIAPENQGRTGRSGAPLPRRYTYRSPAAATAIRTARWPHPTFRPGTWTPVTSTSPTNENRTPAART